MGSRGEPRTERLRKRFSDAHHLARSVRVLFLFFVDPERLVMHRGPKARSARRDDRLQTETFFVVGYKPRPRRIAWLAGRPARLPLLRHCFFNDRMPASHAFPEGPPEYRRSALGPRWLRPLGPPPATVRARHVVRRAVRHRLARGHRRARTQARGAAQDARNPIRHGSARRFCHAGEQSTRNCQPDDRTEPHVT
jgi:hypothetical protein